MRLIIMFTKIEKQKKPGNDKLMDLLLRRAFMKVVMKK